MNNYAKFSKSEGAVLLQCSQAPYIVLFRVIWIYYVSLHQNSSNTEFNCTYTSVHVSQFLATFRIPLLPLSLLKWRPHIPSVSVTLIRVPI